MEMYVKPIFHNGWLPMLLEARLLETDILSYWMQHVCCSPTRCNTTLRDLRSILVILQNAASNERRPGG